MCFTRDRKRKRVISPWFADFVFVFVSFSFTTHMGCCHVLFVTIFIFMCFASGM